MLDTIVYDIETQDTFQQVGSRDPKKLHISCICAYSYNQNQYLSFREEELPYFWRLLEGAGLIVGFNNKGFDDQVCSTYFPEISKIQSFDMLEAFYKAVGFRVKLDNIAQATLGTGKSGDGLQAVQLYAEGKIDELIAYCLQDVKVTKEVFDYGKANGKVMYSDLAGKKEAFVDFSPVIMNEPEQALNLSLF